jgi:hypothetical protein
MRPLRVISCDSKDDWLRAVSVSVYHDFYHLPFYHAIARGMGQGEPLLFVYEHEGYTIALPLLIRSIASPAAQDSALRGWHDATSVYGYVGPIASHSDMPSAVVADFQTSLRAELSQRRIVSVFSRLHPFCDQSTVLAGLGELVSHGNTVSIDLCLDEGEQVAQYRGNHRREIRKLRKLGGRCEEDRGFVHLDKFIDLYYATMNRVHASPQYFYPRSYFRELVASDEAEVLLTFCYLGEVILGAGLFVRCNTTLEYHLGGTSKGLAKFSPMKLLLDRVRHWAYERGVKTFHLGGGVGSQADSLFHFKAGFSARLHHFRTWRWAVLPQEYEHLTGLHERWLADHGYPKSAADFFPKYRSSLPMASTTYTHLGEGQRKAIDAG